MPSQSFFIIEKFKKPLCTLNIKPLLIEFWKDLSKSLFYYIKHNSRLLSLKVLLNIFMVYLKKNEACLIVSLTFVSYIYNLRNKMFEQFKNEQDLGVTKSKQQNLLICH